MVQFQPRVKQKVVNDLLRRFIALNVKQTWLIQQVFKMDCKKCQGTGWYKVPNVRLEIMENVECMDCLAHENFKDHLKGELSRLLINTSQQKLAQIVAQLIVNSVDRNENDDIQRIESIIHTKNTMNALTLAEAYSQ